MQAFLLEAQRLTRTCSWRHDLLSGKVTVSAEGLLIFGIEPEDDASSVDFYNSRNIPKIGPRPSKLMRRLCLEKVILRQIFGLFFRTERSKTSTLSAIPSWTNAAMSWSLSGP